MDMPDRLREIPARVYARIDNGLYSEQSEAWWQPESPFFQMKVAFNPVRIGYARKILSEIPAFDPRGRKALEVGSGGGYISEEVARMGFEVVGIDPSARSVEAARAHAAREGLDIRYAVGAGEAIPAADGSFDAVFCCDVLEHVRDITKTVAEIARVMKPGGVFIYDTINRTFASWLIVIMIGQTWKRWAFLPPRLHVWRMLVKPKELRMLVEAAGLTWHEPRGMAVNVPPLEALRCLRKRAKGEWSYPELGRRIHLVESRSTAVMYMGWAEKPRRA